MSDAADDAQIHEAYYQRLMMAGHRAKLDSTPQVVVGDNVYCVDCDDAILPARLKAVPKAVRCVDCQQLWELLGGG